MHLFILSYLNERVFRSCCERGLFFFAVSKNFSRKRRVAGSVNDSCDKLD